MEICIVVAGLGKPIPKTIKNYGHGTNNVAEWTALIWAVQYAADRGWSNVEIMGDSKLVINQAIGKYQIKKKELQPYKEAFLLASQGMTVSLKHVRRDFNLAGRYLQYGSVK